MIKTRTFQHGRFNYSIKYRQYQMEVIDVDTGKKTMELVHEEKVKYFTLPFYFGKTYQFGLCEDTGAYYRQ